MTDPRFVSKFEINIPLLSRFNVDSHTHTAAEQRFRFLIAAVKLDLYGRLL